MVEKPYFLIGSERSGTTLLRLMLDYHPQIAFNLESEFLVSHLPETGGWPDIHEYRRWLENDRVFRHSGLKINPQLSYRELVDDFLAQKLKRDGKSIVGATVHSNFRYLTRIWPDAGFVYIFRDGRDVSRSIVNMGWAGNLWVAAKWWLRAEEEWDSIRPALREDQWIEVRFEQLITDTRNVLDQICRFMGTEFSEEMFNYASNTTYDLPNKKLLNQWKSNLTNRQLQLVESRLADRLAQRGYEMSGEPRISPSPLYQEWLKLHSRLGTLWFRIRRYGLRLTLKAALARRLGIKRWRRNLQARLDEITDQHLK